MSGDLNVEDFFKDAIKVLDALYRSFPAPITLYVEDICGESDTDEFGMHSKRYLACFSAMLWLQDEGYVRFEDVIRQEAVDQIVLTSQCFTLLSRAAARPTAVNSNEPSSLLAERSTHIAHLRAALKQRDSAVLRRSALAFFDAWHA